MKNKDKKNKEMELANSIMGVFGRIFGIKFSPVIESDKIQSEKPKKIRYEKKDVSGEEKSPPLKKIVEANYQRVETTVNPLLKIKFDHINERINHENIKHDIPYRVTIKKVMRTFLQMYSSNFLPKKIASDEELEKFIKRQIRIAK